MSRNGETPSPFVKIQMLQFGSGWLGSRAVSVLDSCAVGPGFKSQPRRCRVTVLGKLFTLIVHQLRPEPYGRLSSMGDLYLSQFYRSDFRPRICRLVMKSFKNFSSVRARCPRFKFFYNVFRVLCFQCCQCLGSVFVAKLWPDLENILRQSYDYLTIMPTLRSAYDERLIYKTSYEGRKAFLRYDSLAKL